MRYAAVVGDYSSVDNGGTTTSTQLTASVQSATSVIDFYWTGDNTAATAVTAAQIQATTAVDFTLVYRTG
jgi:hypothetical protein